MSVQNEFSGSAENVVQAGAIFGGVHFHGRRVAAPRQTPPVTPHFTNQVRVLREADEAVEAGQRVLVFCGLPGVGKREVAREWLRRRSEQYPDGQFHADLSGDADGQESTALREFLLATGLDAAQIPDTTEGRSACFRSWSTGKRVSVSVDKAITPRQVRLLAPGSGESVVLVTAAGRLPGLGVRDAVAYIDLMPLEDAAAVELLGRVIGRSRLDAEPDAVRELVKACAGLPIALCVCGALVAGRPNRPLDRLVAELADERRRLAALSRHDDLSVTSVFNTAYGRLSPAARRAYRVLGSHPGVGTVSVTVLGIGLSESDVDGTLDDTVDELIRAGLVRETGDDRLVMHDMTRLHARDLAEDGDTVAVARMVEHYREVTVAAGEAAMPARGWLRRFAGNVGGAPKSPMRWLEVERENVLATHGVLFAQGRFLDVCLMAIALWPLHEHGKYLDEQVRVNDDAAVAARELGRADLEALAHVQRAFGLLQGGHPEEAVAVAESALTSASSAGVVELEATAFETIGLAALALSRAAVAEDALRHNLLLAQRIGHDRRVALALLHLAKAVAPAEGRALLTEALPAFAAEPVNSAKVTLWQGITYVRLGDHETAESHVDSALLAMRTHGRLYDQALCLIALADIAVARGQSDIARGRYREALAIAESCGFRPEVRRIRAALGELDPNEAATDAH
ncbi:tetratricopeptide repeat protein [Actinokineospora sp.]|uniref:tetratricopeptide repeat protein n=1 Tax=Actinokineospora sp. TaxID=1872133 RepID=UPI003D6A125E